MFSVYVLRRMLDKGKLKKIFYERLTEPLHLNILSFFVFLLGNYRMKVAFDLIVRQQYAFPILYAADTAKRYGYKAVTIVELGVASGAGLINMCRIANLTTKATGIEFHIVGFDSSVGMPSAVDYRDLPEYYQEGDFVMYDFQRLKNSLPTNCELIIGDVAETIPDFSKRLTSVAPLGFVSVDVDYYTSAKAALRILSEGSAMSYLPIIPVYLDDISVDGSNPWNGELLAVSEYNTENTMRKIAYFSQLRAKRIFKNAQWLDRMFMANIHDHPFRSSDYKRNKPLSIKNEYLS